MRKVLSKKFYVCVFCICFSAFYLAFKTNRYVIELDLKNTYLSDNQIVSQDYEYQSIVTTSLTTLKPQIIAKWKVQSDGTVTHQGNYSNTGLANISFNIQNKQICQNILGTPGIQVIIFIESEIINHNQRQAIRETWGHQSLQRRLGFKIVFVLALHPHPEGANETQTKIQWESEKFGDLIQINVIEDFYNLTFKSIASLKWFIDFCPKNAYYFKTDDDIPIHAFNLIETLKHFANKSHDSILCHENKSTKIIRSLEKVSQIMHSYRHSGNRLQILNALKSKVLKYKINYSQLPGLNFPRYCSGFGYGLGVSVAERLYRTALTIPYFQFEDVFITGFCRQKADISIEDTKRLTFRPVMTPSDGLCVTFSGGRINSNEMSAKDLRQLWGKTKPQTIGQTSLPCPPFLNNR